MNKYGNEFLATTKTAFRVGNIIRITETQKDSWGKTRLAKGTYKIMNSGRTWRSYRYTNQPPTYEDAVLEISKYTKAGKVFPNTKRFDLKTFDKWSEAGICVIEDSSTDTTTAGKVVAKSKHPSKDQWREVFTTFGVNIRFTGSSMQKVSVPRGKVSLNGKNIDAERELIFYTNVSNRMKTFIDLICALSEQDITEDDVQSALNLAAIK